MTSLLPSMPALRVSRLVAAILVAALLAIVPQLALPKPAVACSCVGPQPLAQYANDGSVILSGRVVGKDAMGVQVAVDRWFSGLGATRAVWITGDFTAGMCGVGSEPPAGSQWIWVAWRPEGELGLSISMCTPTGDLATPEGQALLAEAEATFGDVGVTLPGSGVAPGTPEAPAASFDPLPVAVAGGVVGAAILVLAGTAFVARRRSEPRSPEG